MAKEPAWRSTFERPDAHLKPFRGRGLTGPVPIPSYVQRWLVVSSLQRRPNRSEDMAAAILTEACDSYFRLHAPPLPFELISGTPLDPTNDRAAQIAARAIERIAGTNEGRPPVAAGVANTAYAWIFRLPLNPDAADKFRAWIAEAWMIKPAVVQRGGWPVIVLPRGEWPIDPRLIPGTPVALPELNANIEGREQSPRQRHGPGRER